MKHKGLKVSGVAFANDLSISSLMVTLCFAMQGSQRKNITASDLIAFYRTRHIFSLPLPFSSPLSHGLLIFSPLLQTFQSYLRRQPALLKIEPAMEIPAQIWSFVSLAVLFGIQSKMNSLKGLWKSPKRPSGLTETSLSFPETSIFFRKMLLQARFYNIIYNNYIANSQTIRKVNRRKIFIYFIIPQIGTFFNNWLAGKDQNGQRENFKYISTDVQYI